MLLRPGRVNTFVLKFRLMKFIGAFLYSFFYCLISYQPVGMMAQDFQPYKLTFERDTAFTRLVYTKTGFNEDIDTIIKYVSIITIMFFIKCVNC